jgi:hypothetical protein
LEGGEERTRLADPNEVLGNDRVEALADVVVLLNDHADEVGLVGESFEEQERLDGVAVVVEESGEKVRLRTSSSVSDCHGSSARAEERTFMIARCSTACWASSLRSSRSIVLT